MENVPAYNFRLAVFNLWKWFPVELKAVSSSKNGDRTQWNWFDIDKTHCNSLHCPFETIQSQIGNVNRTIQKNSEQINSVPMKFTHNWIFLL